MAKIAQWRRVLAHMQKVGSYGVDRTEFMLPMVCDGLEPILNFPARIQEIEEKGYVIGTPSKRHGDCTVYVLHSEPSPRVVKQTKPLDAAGYCRRYLCMVCFGTFENRADACGRGRLEVRLEDPRQAVLGCRKIIEQEVRRAA